MSDSISVNDLYNMCKKMLSKGMGDKTIMISSDEEGNSYHTLFFGFVSDIETLQQCKDYGMFIEDVNPEDVVLLG